MILVILMNAVLSSRLVSVRLCLQCRQGKFWLSDVVGLFPWCSIYMILGVLMAMLLDSRVSWHGANILLICFLLCYGIHHQKVGSANRQQTRCQPHGCGQASQVILGTEFPESPLFRRKGHIRIKPNLDILAACCQRNHGHRTFLADDHMAAGTCWHSFVV